MNSPQVRTWAKAFAQRLEREAKVNNPDDLAPVIQRAYTLALSREPRGAELKAATNFIRHGLAAGRDQALTDFCQTLRALNEFSYEN
jgi:hypothetical protein